MTDGGIVGVEKNKDMKTVEKWSKMGFRVAAAPSLGNIDGDNEKDLEVTVGLMNGTLIVIDPDGSKDPPIKWTYTVDEKPSAVNGEDIRGHLGFTAISDIDHDGKAEIIFTDYRAGLYDWNGTLYVLEDNGNTYTEKAALEYGFEDESGGAQGAPSVVNLDSDDNLEIHHTQYDNNIDNLRLLCLSCHKKVHQRVCRGKKSSKKLF